LTPKQNFLETVKWGQPEYLATDLDGLNLLLDPLTGTYDENMKDEWGCQWGYSNKENNPFPCILPGEPVITDIVKWRDQVTIPDTGNFDYSIIKAQAKEVDRSRQLVGMSCSCGLFERAHALMGFENCLIAVIEEPEAMKELLDCIMDFKIAYIDRLYQASEFDLFYYHDDWGSKHSLFLSPKVWCDMIKPRQKKIVEHVKSLSKDKEILFMHHSDTYLEPLIPEMIELKIDIWQGAIPQNDIVMLQKKYRGRIAYHGGIDIAAIDYPIPDEDKIRAEVRRAIDTYAPNGGIIIGIPSLAAIFPRVQEIYLDELAAYSKLYNMDNIPFSEKELEKTGEYFKIPDPGTLPKYNFPISPKENYYAAVKAGKPLWLPNYYDTVTLCPACYPDAIARGFVMGPESPEYMDESKKGGRDAFGISWVYVPVAGGSMVKPGKPLLDDMNEWKDRVDMPAVDSWDWEGSRNRFTDYLKKEDAVCVMWIFTGFFERLISLMDFENAAIALVDEDQQDAIREFFSECCSAYEKIIKHYKEDFDCDVIYFHDDWGSQRASFFSMETCMNTIVPYLKRLVDYTHSLGMVFEMHSCGKNEYLLPCYLAAGIDIWAPQEQNDTDKIIKEANGKIVIGFWGNAPKDASDEEKYDAGKAWAEKYCTDYQKHPVYHCDLWDIEEKFKEGMYVESRKIFCREGN